jgi:hypothetical protein
MAKHQNAHLNKWVKENVHGVNRLARKKELANAFDNRSVDRMA